MGVLLLFVPLTILASRLGWSPSLQFFLAVAAVIPLAAYVGAATEYLADRLGGKVGGMTVRGRDGARDQLDGFHVVPVKGRRLGRQAESLDQPRQRLFIGFMRDPQRIDVTGRDADPRGDRAKFGEAAHPGADAACRKNAADSGAMLSVGGAAAEQ